MPIQWRRRISEHRPGSWVPQDPPCRVLSTSVSGTRMTLEDGTVVEADPYEDIPYPRRKDGSTVDWGDLGLDPDPRSVFAGDILPDGRRVAGRAGDRLFFRPEVVEEDIIRVYGPYVYEPTGHVVFVAWKPYRGSWTGGLLAPEEIEGRGNRVYFVTPPKGRSSWARLTYEPGMWDDDEPLPPPYYREPGLHPRDTRGRRRVTSVTESL